MPNGKSRRVAGPSRQTKPKSGGRHRHAYDLVDEQVDPRTPHRHAEPLTWSCGRHVDADRFHFLAVVREVAGDDSVDRAGAVLGNVQGRYPALTQYRRD